ncbi:MAG: hypothetical protein EOO40_09380 [Deltaproteobacteria bacterium]|nr:MAG: hypothetical protein EOO40_09380 [Deltaproteobacteria bacterium]
MEDATLVTGIETHRFTAGYDLTLLGLYKAGMLRPCVVDRGFLSNVVFDLMQDRISEQQAEGYVRFLASHDLLRNVTMLHVLGRDIPDERNKDRWAFLEAPRYASLYARYAALAQELEPSLELLDFQNNFDDDSWQRFMNLFDWQQTPNGAV